MLLPNRKYKFYSYPCEVGNHQVSDSHILPIKCQGCRQQMCVDHRVKWGPYCKACWPTVPPETQQALIAECKAIRRRHRIQFMKDLPKVLVLAPLWFMAYIWQSIKKRWKKEKPAPKVEQHPPLIDPNSDHP